MKIILFLLLIVFCSFTDDPLITRSTASPPLTKDQVAAIGPVGATGYGITGGRPSQVSDTLHQEFHLFVLNCE